MKAKFVYDHSKRMWYKFYSTCCGHSLEQKMLFNDKPVGPDFKLNTSTKVPTRVRLWSQFLYILRNRKKPLEDFDYVTSTKPVRFRYYCTGCGKRNNGDWELKYKK